MARIIPEDGEVNARIVYWGIDGAGKRTSLRGVYQKLRPDHRGEMREVPTRIDPSVSYTVLPIELGDVGGTRTRIEMLAVPGAREHAPTRKQLLDCVDGIVFVVDCQPGRLEDNLASLEELSKSLDAYARSIDEIPLVVQYNKRDLCDTTEAEELHRRLGLREATVFEAIATEGSGLLPALSTISKKVIRALRGESAGPTRASAVPEPAPPPEPEPPAAPVLEVSPAAHATDPRLAMEEAILAEAEHPERLEAQEQSGAAEAMLDEQTWHHGAEELDVPGGARIGRDLSIVSVGEAYRGDPHSVRVPIVLGDSEGGTSTLVLTVRLDPLIDDDGTD